jgi:hypothetical protein
MIDSIKRYRTSNVYYLINATLLGCVIAVVLYNFIPVGKFHEFDVTSFIPLLPGLGAGIVPVFATPGDKTSLRLKWLKEQNAMNQLYILIFGEVIVLIVTLLLKDAFVHNFFKALNIGVSVSFFILNLLIGFKVLRLYLN